MSIAGDDDTVASSLPTTLDGSTLGTDGELVSGRYRIVRWLGGGGMGRVYEALDTELEERVALKVLKAGLSDEAIERFRREVKLTRRLQHRNIARMFDIGEHKGEKFLTMELVEGEPLTRRMSDKPMPWPQLEGIAKQVCAGLAAAHAGGVVHRDLKPDNVLVEQGTERAVLTDFGIARSGDDPSVTQVGAIVGTPRYMAPEQLAGREVDFRADLFSLGVMLFELATATRPWPGDNAITIAVSQATQAARTIDTQTSAVPAYFAATVAACIQLEPRDRPASASEILDALEQKRPATVALRTITGPAPAPAPRPRAPTGAPRTPATPTLHEATALAVLPITCAPGDEYLADGLLDDLTDTLSTSPGLRVRPAGIVRQTQSPDPREIGQRLQVDHIVAASLRRTPAGLRIATRLISVADGFQIWASKNDCTEAEILDVGDELARGIASALSTRAPAESKPVDPRAVDLYLRARAELRRFWGSHVAEAVKLLEQAVDYAPTSAPILAAAAYANVQHWVMRGENDLLQPAQRALERGLATGHGEAYLASAQYQFNRGDFERGATDLARALSRAPMAAPSHELAARILIEVEGTTTARSYFETARGLDPGRSAIISADLARADALEGSWETAFARVDQLLADPDPALQQLGTIGRGRLTIWQGNAEALTSSGRQFLTRISPNAGAIFKFVTQVEAHGGIEEDMWRSMLGAEIDPQKPLRQYLVRLQIFTEVALALGHHDKAIEALSRVVDLGLMDITWVDRCPLLSRINDHPRFATLRARVAERAARVASAFHSSTTGTHSLP